jgi:arsenate reductase (thioredoxin)
MALDLLTRLNHPVTDLRSKSWDEFAAPGAPQMDFVFTVCDSAAAEECPFWPGQPVTAHWGLPDPAAVTESEVLQHVAFNDTYRMLRGRIMAFTSLLLDSLDQLSLQKRVRDIGQSPDAAAS